MPSELMHQKTTRNVGVTIRIEKETATSSRQIVAKVLAFHSALISSFRLVSLLDLKKPHNRKITCHVRSAAAKIKQFESLIRMDINWANETPRLPRKVRIVAKP